MIKRSTHTILFLSLLAVAAIQIACSEDDGSGDAATSNGTTGTSNGTTDTSNGTTGTTDTRSEYSFVLIEDMGTAGAGEANPGSDLDAVGIVPVDDGVERFATTVEEDNVTHSGTSIDTTQVIGAPDSNCQAENFVSLGGAAAGGYIIVGFSDESTNFIFKSGDRVNVYELGPSSCPSQPTWLDDPYTVSVSVGNTKDQFTAAGIATATGVNTFLAP